jgi:hypothetical protein
LSCRALPVASEDEDEEFPEDALEEEGNCPVFVDRDGNFVNVRLACKSFTGQQLDLAVLQGKADGGCGWR